MGGGAYFLNIQIQNEFSMFQFLVFLIYLYPDKLYDILKHECDILNMLIFAFTTKDGSIDYSGVHEK